MPQRERPGFSVEQIEATFQIPHNPENKVSGGRIESFREGWALPMFGGGKTHYYTRSELNDIATSKCGVVTPVRKLFGEGNFPRCKRCAKTVK